MSCREANIVSRRRFLGNGAASLALWSLMPKMAVAGTRDPRLLVVVLRGGLDGLAAVAPVGDPDYARLRGSIALPASGEGAGLPARRLLRAQRRDATVARPVIGTGRRSSFMPCTRLIARARTSTGRTCSKAACPASAG